MTGPGDDEQSPADDPDLGDRARSDGGGDRPPDPGDEAAGADESADGSSRPPGSTRDPGPLTPADGVAAPGGNSLRTDSDEPLAADELAGFGRVISHDLGNALAIAAGRIELARETGADEEFDAAAASLTRAEELLEELTTALESGGIVADVAPVDVGAVLERAWATQETGGATVETPADLRVLADERALLRLFENLVRNAFEHGEHVSTVRLGRLHDGFYVVDDGVGVPDDVRERVFDPGFTTKRDGRGVGLASIRRIARAHGWAVRLVPAADGGARFEFLGVDAPPDAPD